MNDIQECYPITTQCGCFELLSFDPGPIHISLNNLVILSSPKITILTPSLTWTSYQHVNSCRRTPNFMPSTVSSSQVAELQRHATTSNCLLKISWHTNFIIYKKYNKMRQRGIEPRSTAWKATMLTITPLTLIYKTLINFLLYIFKKLCLICILQQIGGINFESLAIRFVYNFFRTMVT